MLKSYGRDDLSTENRKFYILLSLVVLLKIDNAQINDLQHSIGHEHFPYVVNVVFSLQQFKNVPGRKNSDIFRGALQTLNQDNQIVSYFLF